MFNILPVRRQSFRNPKRESASFMGQRSCVAFAAVGPHGRSAGEACGGTNRKESAQLRSCSGVGFENAARRFPGPCDEGAPSEPTAMRLITKGHRLGTRGSYAGKFQKFVQFCTTEQSRAGRGHLAFLPASQRTLLAYLGSLSEEGIQYIQETSFNPYISTVNQANSLLNLPKPSIGNRVDVFASCAKAMGRKTAWLSSPRRAIHFRQSRSSTLSVTSTQRTRRLYENARQSCWRSASFTDGTRDDEEG